MYILVRMRKNIRHKCKMLNRILRLFNVLLIRLFVFTGHVLWLEKDRNTAKNRLSNAEDF